MTQLFSNSKLIITQISKSIILNSKSLRMSSSSRFPLSPCTVDDVPAMAAVYNAAFVSDGISVVAMPQTIPLTVKNVWLYERLRVAFEKPGIRHWKCLDDDTGKIVAWMRWEIPTSSTANVDVETQEKGEGEGKKAMKMGENQPILPEGANIPFWTLMFKSIDGMREKWAKPDMHVCHFLITDPTYQGKGLGSKLLRHGLALTDAEGARAYIEATKAGHPL